MNPRLLLLPACACLSACLTLPQSAPPVAPPEVAKTGYGAFTDVGPQREAWLADEAARQLTRIHPPQHTLLDFQQRLPAEDGFGQRLMSALQRDGYFLRRWYDPAMAPQCGQRPAGGQAGEAFRIVPACYVLDSVAGMLRLTLYTAGDAWSRLFTVTEEQDALRPAGAWTRQRAE
jgi:hypothetical protein